MKIKLSYNDKEPNISTDGKFDNDWIRKIEKLLEESILDKRIGVKYDSSRENLALKLKRLIWKKKSILGIFFYNAADKKNSIPCIVTINRVKKCDIYEDPKAIKREVGVGLKLLNDKIIISSGAEHDSDAYCINLKIDAIDITIEDI